jgi:glutamate formiminotransferase
MVEDGARQIAAAAVELIDISSHVGVHPRLGALDVVPFVPLSLAPAAASSPGIESTADHQRHWSDVLAARDRFAAWAGQVLALPCFLYGPERSLPDIRRTAFDPLPPDTGPSTPHPTAGAAAVGCRPVLIAYNVWITSNQATEADPGQHSLAVARTLAKGLRGPSVRALGLPVAGGAQVSFNLIDPGAVSVQDVYDAVARGAESKGCSVWKAELVGLLPADALAEVPRHRWPELDLDEHHCIEGLIQAIG